MSISLFAPVPVPGETIRTAMWGEGSGWIALQSSSIESDKIVLDRGWTDKMLQQRSAAQWARRKR